MKINQPRLFVTSCLLAVACCVFGITSTRAYIGQQSERAMVDPSWSPTGSLNVARSNHTATLLPSGKVLVVGGVVVGTTLKSAELYDPMTGFWTNTGSLNVGRWGHTATLLPSGKVLITGGGGNPSPPVFDSSELYDPNTGIWNLTGSLNTGRMFHATTLLPSGKVLVSGGSGTNGPIKLSELYDPTTGNWTVTGNLNTARARHTATLLPSGKVLACCGFIGGTTGGPLADAELYDPSTGIWTLTGRLNQAHTTGGPNTATLLPSGKVLVTGGGIALSELYDPATGVWTVTGNLNKPRSRETATLLLSGKVLVAGGDFFGAPYSAELYDPNTGLWSYAGNLNADYLDHTATLLLSGKVIVAGGSNGKSAEIYEGIGLSVNNPVPTITSIDPDWITRGTSTVPLTVKGVNFVNGAILRWNGNNRPTTYVNNEGLTAVIPSTDISTVGTASVTVFNPPIGGGISNAVSFLIANPLANVSAAHFFGGNFAPESMIAAFGTGLATMAQVASTVPLPTSMAGTTVVVRDSEGKERLAPLFFVSPTQVNYQIPPSTSLGCAGCAYSNAVVTITGAAGAISSQAVRIAAISPGIFSANSSGSGVAAGQVLRFRADNTQSYEPIARYDSTQNKFVPVPIDLGAPTDQVFLILYGTGIRFFSSLDTVKVSVGGVASQVLFAGPQGDFVGLDQINLRLLRTLIGRGEVDVAITVNGIFANRVQISIK